MTAGGANDMKIGDDADKELVESRLRKGLNRMTLTEKGEGAGGGGKFIRDKMEKEKISLEGK